MLVEGVPVDRIAHYRLRRPIGSGAMADVYEAEDTRTGAIVALKVIAEHVRVTSEGVARFVREGRALQNLRHANIVRVLDQGITDNGIAWLALERLQGVSLEVLIRNEGQLHPSRAFRVVRDIAKALSLVHARGMVHRDVKPENVFIVLPGTPQEQAKLIDFGIARLTEAELGENSVMYTRVNAMLGTAAFAAPEQMNGSSAAGPAADVFSLGVTAYEMLTGALPFPGDTMKEQLKSKLSGRVAPLAPRVREAAALSPDFVALVSSCLALDPAARPKDGLALLSLLAACIERSGGPVPMSMFPPPATAAAASRRSSRTIEMALAVAVTLAVVTGIALWFLFARR